MTAPPSLFKGGWFTVPGSTGNFSVTGVGFQPQIVLFFGSNETTEDTVMTGGGRSLMRGCMAWDDVSSSIMSWCMSFIPHDAVRWEQHPIVSCKDGSAGTDYEATAVSFNTNGFTVNFTTVPASTRKVHWAAIGGMDHVTSGIHTGRSNYTIGWAPLSGLHLGGLDDTTLDPKGPNAEASDWGHMLTLGGASWPDRDGDAATRRSMSIELVDTPFSSQTRLDMRRDTGTTAYVGTGAHFVGPFMTEAAHEQYPIATGDVARYVDVANQGHFVEIDAYSETGGVLPEVVVDDSTIISSTLTEIDRPSLILFLGVCGFPQGANLGPNAATFGFWTKDHQYSVAGNGADGSFYQSAQYGFTSTVSTSGVHAGTVTALSPGIALLTTKVSDIAPASMEWHMFGRQTSGFVPQIYRRRPV